MIDPRNEPLAYYCADCMKEIEGEPVEYWNQGDDGRDVKEYYHVVCMEKFRISYWDGGISE